MNSRVYFRLKIENKVNSHKAIISQKHAPSTFSIEPDPVLRSEFESIFESGADIANTLIMRAVKNV